LNKGLGTALCFWVAVNTLAAKELTLDDIFPSDRVLDVQITVADEDWDTIRHQGRDFFSALHKSRKVKPPDSPYTYVDASVTIDGVEFPEVGLRKKGFLGSLSTTRPSLKIKLNYIDKEAGIDGLTNLTLNNNQQDGSLVSQFMGYALFNAAGSPAPRCAYAKVSVNGVNLGIYSHVETMRKPLLKRAFDTHKGTLYEGTYVDFYPGWEGSFDRKRGKDEPGREKIKQLIKVLESDDDNIEEAIGELVDLDSFYTFWAVEGLLGFADGYSDNHNNFFIYLKPATDKSLGGKVGASEGRGDKFHFIPWGADTLFTKRSGSSAPGAPISAKIQGLIAYKLYQQKSGRERYAKTMMDIIEKHWNEAELLAETERIEKMVKPHLVQAQISIIDEVEMKEEDVEVKATFAGSLEEKREFIRQHRDDIINEIANGMPEWKKSPNEPLLFGAGTYAIWMALQVVSGIRPRLDFNRVQGLVLGGATQVSTAKVGGRVYGSLEYGFTNDIWNYRLGAEKNWLGEHKIAVGFELHKITDTNDAGLLSETEDFLSTFLFGDAFSDYFLRDGYRSWLSRKLTPSTKMQVQYNKDEYSSLSKMTDWCLFSPKKSKSLNREIDDGTLRSITFSCLFDSRDVKKHKKQSDFTLYPVPCLTTKNGWLGELSLEFAGNILGGDFDYLLYHFKLARYNRIATSHAFDFRVQGGISTKGLPIQKQFYIGGIGTLRGYDFKEFVGDNMLLANVEYSLKLSPHFWASVFWDSGCAWFDGQEIGFDDFHSSAGLGIKIGDEARTIILYFARPLGEERKSDMILRLDRMF